MTATAKPAATEKPKSAPAPHRAVAAVLPRPKTEEDQIMYQVRDKLATDKPRTHELLDTYGRIHKIKFPDADTHVQVPMSMAAQLIGNDGFEVLNENGHEMRAQKIDDSTRQGVILSYDQTIAKYGELTHEALVARGNHAGGKYNKSNSKEEIISFLIEIGLNEVSKDPTEAAVADGDPELEEEDEYA